MIAIILNTVIFLAPYFVAIAILFFGKLRDSYPVSCAIVFAIFSIISNILAWARYDQIKKLDMKNRLFWGKLYPRYFYLGYFIPLLFYIFEMKKNIKLINYLNRINMRMNIKATLYLYYTIVGLVIIGIILQTVFGSNIILYDFILIILIHQYVWFMVILDIVIRRDEFAIEKYLSYNQMVFGCADYLKERMSVARSLHDK